MIFLLVMPSLLKRLGFKRTIPLGIAAWAVRYVAIGFGDVGTTFWLVLVSLILHGNCCDFLFVAGQLYTDHVAAPEIRSSAQCMISLATYGVGLMLGTPVSGPIVDALITDGVHQWQTIWLIPAAFAALVAIFFALCFQDRGVGQGAGHEGRVTVTAGRTEWSFLVWWAPCP